MDIVLFVIAGALSLAGGVGVVAARKPVHSALALLLVLGSLAVLYLTLAAEFVAVLQVILYAGAIVVLFLFVIMLVMPRLGAQLAPSDAGSLRPAAAVFGGALAAMLAYAALRGMRNMTPQALAPSFGSVESIGRSLFTEFVLPFQIASLLLLVGIITAVVLGKAPGRS